MMLLLAFLFTLAFSACPEQSFAVPAGDYLYSLGGATHFGVSQTLTVEAMKQIFPLLYRASALYNNGFQANAFVGFANKNFYQVQYCMGLYNMSTQCSAAIALGYTYLGYAQNPPVLGTTNRLVWFLDQNGNTVDVAGAPFGISYNDTTDYDCTTRAWWNIPDKSFSASFSFASGGYGDAYTRVHPTCANAYYGVNHRADEPCEGYTCYANSISKLHVTELSKKDLTSTDPYVNFARMMSAINAYNETDRTYSLFMCNRYSKSFYMLHNCKHPSLASASHCVAVAAKGGQWAGIARDTALYGDAGLRHVYLVKPDGTTATIIGEVITLSAFDPSTRIWFTQKNGWTPQFTFSTGPLGQAFLTTVGTAYTLGGERVANAEICTPVALSGNPPVSGAGQTSVISLVSLLVAMLITALAFLR